MIKPEPLSGRIGPGQFPTTHWSRVVTAGDRAAPEAQVALAALCNSYWYPIYAFVRRCGNTPEQAQDTTQDFFAYVLERNLLAQADPERGRFRAFLRTVCGRFVAAERDRANTQKRGGGRTVFSIDASDAEGRYTRETADELTAERIFDRSWALTLLGRVFDQLEREYADAGRLTTFEALKGAMAGEAGAESYVTIAARLGTTEGAVRVAVHRLRRRYGLLLRQEIAATVDDTDQVDDEIRALFGALEH
jgi:RNA polymerase sigma factor (sigma-70 family)